MELSLVQGSGQSSSEPVKVKKNRKRIKGYPWSAEEEKKRLRRKRHRMDRPILNAGVLNNAVNLGGNDDDMEEEDVEPIFKTTESEGNPTEQEAVSGASTPKPAPYPYWPTPQIHSVSGDYVAYSSSSLYPEEPGAEDVGNGPVRSQEEDGIYDLPNTDHIRNICELQSMQEITCSELLAARELSAKLEKEKFALIRTSNAEYLAFQQALNESKKTVESANAKALEVTKWVRLVQTFDPDMKTPEDLKNFFLRKETETDKLRSNNSLLGKRVTSLDKEINGLRRELNVAKENETKLRTKVKQLEKHLTQVSKEWHDLNAKIEPNKKAMDTILSYHNE